jgi:site-specific DNA-methyltransferase (adenine-specific)
LSADVIGILQDDLRLLLRGEIIWLKQRGSSGSCAWGSFQRPGNPVLRDLTERVVVASKGRFDRAVPARRRARDHLPSEASMTREDFMENTLDVWEIPAESATRVGHPAPFPIELPARLIELYTYRGDLVLDPFAGSGSAAVAAVRSGRHYVGYDLDQSYVRLAEQRVGAERLRLEEAATPGAPSWQVCLPSAPVPAATNGGAQAAAIREGKPAREIARAVLEAAGFSDIDEGLRRPGGVEIDFAGRDSGGTLWFFQVPGAFTTHRAGLKRTDVLWKTLAKAAVLRELGTTPLVVLAAGTPAPAMAGAGALKYLTGPGKPIHSVIDLLTPAGLGRLRSICEGSA